MAWCNLTPQQWCLLEQNSSTAASLCSGYWTQLLESLWSNQATMEPKSFKFTQIQHYDMVQETSTYGLTSKNSANSNLKPEYTKGRRLVDFL